MDREAVTGGEALERTIYSKYSNERAERFCIRTDITSDHEGTRRIYKWALLPGGRAHVERFTKSFQGLMESYGEEALRFCPCSSKTDPGGNVCAVFPFLSGESLQEILKRAVQAQDENRVDRLLREYVRRIGTEGGERPFVVTDEFEEIFGALPSGGLPQGGGGVPVSACISDIDMIFSNLFVNAGDGGEENAPWEVIDYEWTFSFPIPKRFLIYRGLYFAYYQILHDTGRSLADVLALAGITKEEAAVYQQMEEHFQAYIGRDTIPVRNMQRLLGTAVIPLEELLCKARQEQSVGSTEGLKEALLVRRIYYQIDRLEYQDGSHICSGWAFAKAWNGRCLPVHIQVRGHGGQRLPAEIVRGARKDVAEAFHLRCAGNPAWGFDCVFLAPQSEEWEMIFSLGRKECTYRCESLK